MEEERTIDPRAAEAYTWHSRVLLEEWRCPNSSCRQRLAALWSTLDGKILTWNSAAITTTTDDRRRMLDAGVVVGGGIGLDGSQFHIQFVDDLGGMPKSLTTVCPKHGPREIPLTIQHH